MKIIYPTSIKTYVISEKELGKFKESYQNFFDNISNLYTWVDFEFDKENKLMFVSVK